MSTEISRLPSCSGSVVASVTYVDVDRHRPAIIYRALRAHGTASGYPNVAYASRLPPSARRFHALAYHRSPSRSVVRLPSVSMTSTVLPSVPRIANKVGQSKPNEAERGAQGNSKRAQGNAQGKASDGNGRLQTTESPGRPPRGCWEAGRLPAPVHLTAGSSRGHPSAPRGGDCPRSCAVARC